MTWGEPVARGAQKKPDLIEGIALASAVTGRVLLDAATHLIESIASELDNMEGIEDAGGVLELIVDGILSIPGRDPPSRSGYRSEGYRSETVRRARPASSHARYQTFPGPGPLKWAVGWSFPRVVPDTGEFTGPSSTSVLVMPHASHQPPAPEPPQKRSYRTKRVGFVVTFRLFWCGKIGIEVGGSQLEGWTKRVGFVATFRLAGAGKSALKLVVSSWEYEYPQMPGVRASDDQVWALSVRGAAMALLPVQYQPGQPH